MAELAAPKDPRASIERLAEQSGTAVFKISGEIDLSSVEQLQESIGPLLEDPPERVAFELDEVRFLDSSGIALFLTVADRVSNVELRNPSRTIRRIIEVTGLSTVLRMTP